MAQLKAADPHTGIIGGALQISGFYKLPKQPMLSQLCTDVMSLRRRGC
jgi:hypothetical protein